MAEVIEAFRTFVQDNLLIVLGIMGLGVLYLIFDRELTLLCPADQSAMRKIDKDSFQCNRCGFIKRV